ncbi:MAG TPA: chemotaxis protein CheW [Verrucomicrobiae bacterium]|nr:chemotaxis protein CheW [Verrucomicrobiae bacterium]
MADTQDRGLLAERAAQLARPAAAPDEPTVALLSFTVNHTRCALELACVREVLPGGLAARLPTGRHLLGWIVNVRGELLAVADTARVLDPSAPPGAGGGPVVVVGGPGAPLGLAIDGPADLVQATTLLPPPPTGHAAPLSGATSDGLVVIDAAALLADPRLFVARENPMERMPDPRSEPVR